MDLQKIGRFLKILRKESNLTQEQLAEVVGVAARTVSRWETGSNMPELSILIQLSEIYDVDLKEIIEGERRNGSMDNETKEILEMVADYSEEEKKKAVKIGNVSFWIIYLTCAAAIALQLVLFADLKLVAGETAALAIGGISYLVLITREGVWDAGASKKRTPINDVVLSVLFAGAFSILYAITIFRMSGGSEKTPLYTGLFFIGISVLCFLTLRLLAFWSYRERRRKEMK